MKIMKRIIVIHLALFLFSSQAYSQQLLNTEWQVYVGSPVTDTLQIEYKTDSSILYLSDTILVISNYYETGDTLSIVDIGGAAACPLSDTGSYTFGFVADTLKFVLISDPCFGRGDFFSNNLIIRLNTGVSNSYETPEVEVYPNPNPEGIFKFKIKTKGSYDITIEIYSIQGKRLKRITNLRSTKVTIDLSSYANGIYIARIGSKQFSKIFKLIK